MARWLKLGVAVTAASLWLLATGSPARAQPGPTAAESPSQARSPDRYLEVIEVTPWVQPDGEWTATFTTAKPVPDGSTVSVSIRGALDGDDAETVRQQIRDIEQGASPGQAVQDPDPWVAADLITGDLLSLDLPVRSRAGSATRQYLPNPGVHPVVVTLESAEGEELDEHVLFLTRLPISTDRAPLQLGLWLPIDSAVTVTPDSEVVVPTDAGRAMARATRLANLSRVPLNVAPDPALLDALESSDADDVAALEDFSTAIVDDSIQRRTWTAIDSEAWARSGDLADLQVPVLAGQVAQETRLDREVQGSVWADDPTLGPDAMGLMSALGTQYVLADPGRVGPPSDPEGSLAGSTQTFLLEGPDAPLPAITVDPTLALMMGDDTRSSGEVAHRVLSEIQAIWFASGRDTPAVVLPLDQRVETANAEAVLEQLSIGPTPTMAATSLPNLFDRTTMAGTDNDPERRALLPREDVPDVAPLSSFLEKMRVRVSAYHSTMSEEPELAPLDHLLLGAQHRGLAEPEQRALIDEAARRVDADFAQIQPPTDRSFTVTSRSATIPLQFTNGLDRPVRVHVNFFAPRLDFTDGDERFLILQPGPNRIDLDVVARTSGQFNLTVEMLTADQEVVLSQERLGVRSTAFSGVGLVLGGGAILVILVWWIRTLRKKRRDDDPPTDPDEEGPSTPDPSTPNIAEAERPSTSSVG